MEKTVLVADVNKGADKEQVEMCYKMFEFYFKDTYEFLKDTNFQTKKEFKEYLMKLDKDLIRKETVEDIEKLKIMGKSDKQLLALLVNVESTIDTPEGRFNFYKFASWYKAIMLSKEQNLN